MSRPQTARCGRLRSACTAAAATTWSPRRELHASSGGFTPAGGDQQGEHGGQRSIVAHPPDYRFAPKMPGHERLTAFVYWTLSRVLAGPWCTANPGGPRRRRDQDRASRARRRHAQLGTAFPEGRRRREPAESAYYLGTNRNKRSVTATLPSPPGQALVRDLVSIATCSWRTCGRRHGALRARRRSLRQLNPKLVYCSVTGYDARPAPTGSAPATTTPSRAWAG